MTLGPWFDLFLLALVVGVVFVAMRLGPGRSSVLFDDVAEEETPARARGSFYARVVRQAGFGPERFRWFYWMSKLACALVLPLASLEVFVSPFWGVVLLGVVGFFVPDAVLLWLRRRRQRRIRSSLSYFLDLLVALLHSGLALEPAFRRAGRQGLAASHPLADEIELVARELDVGRERSAAFAAIADRTGVREIHAVASALQLGARLGTPIEATLHGQADLLRTRHHEATLRQINTAATKALFPVLLCGFPMFLVIVFYPTVLEVVRSLGAIFGQLF